ncbi:uncharacterized protein BJ171DRAFT_499625 [Polychytrium aggregatum]|uniref:uncharacterized protein n=1 Tax=Polychytrium aggregatum TaxID=110093 RepID=UPI0022FE61D5|nr:uncharacterized protein BJ171DRAFT_499625 [Polychytrium aggregatum]KAI9205799.1 hypothetical protein BJ171DRAFT_499625 [Polychytrium aggregatum]
MHTAHRSKRASDDELLKLLSKHIRTTLFAENPLPAALEGIAILDQLVGNLIRFPAEDKYRLIRLRNKRLAGSLFNLTGSVDCLVMLGFLVRVREFEEVLEYSHALDDATLAFLLKFQQDLEKLRSEATLDYQQQTRRAAKAREQVESRRDIVLQQIEDDRTRVRDRSQMLRQNRVANSIAQNEPTTQRPS